MAKYAPIPGCAACTAIGAMCLNCAFAWKERHVDEELRILRRIAGMAATIPDYPGIAKAVVQWRAHRRKKPARLPRTKGAR